MASVKPYCPHCKKYIKHKFICKKFTQAGEDAYQKQLEWQEIQKKLNEEKKIKLDEEFKKASIEYPLILEYFQEKIKELEDRIDDYSCDCRCHYNNSYGDSY